jgi:hypothetical protein
MILQLQKIFVVGLSIFVYPICIVIDPILNPLCPL